MRDFTPPTSDAVGSMSAIAILRQLQSHHLIGEEQAVKQLVNCVMICGLEQTSTRL
jgi:hypothetical protein